jgi:uncharacterized protein YjbI with pentapeptide repeats
VVLDDYAGSWFIVDSSVVGYDGGRNVRDEERSVGQKKLVRKAEPPSKRKIRWSRWTGFRGRTVWDWLQMLVVPLMLVAVGFWFTTQQEVRQQQIEDQRSQDTALQAYFDGMTNLLIDEQGTQLHKLEPDTEVQRLIQARTDTLFAILDKDREVSVVLFLARSDVIPKGDPLVSLAGIDLSFIDLRGIDLSETSLAGSTLRHAILTNANLSRSDLGNANLSEADLGGANLSEADLGGANLIDANLGGANLSDANLSGASLSDARLSRADLSEADLSEADLSYADLRDAKGVTNKELEQQAATLKGATLP